ncbi:MAG: helicase HerA domain-containing protein [Candidatus Micrarchaeia archaeon]
MNLEEAEYAYSANAISGAFYSELSYNPEIEQLILAAKNGAYIGNTKKGDMPVFIDFGQLLNPHIFVCGTTGSGKTYLLKSLMKRLGTIMQIGITCIDFTGEYADYFSAGVPANSSYYGLANESEHEKIEAASRVMEQIIEEMRRSGVKKEPSRFIFLDEAWKLLGPKPSFTTLLREGRKYGVGLVMASQLLEDLAMPLLDNVASIFVFRLQNKQSIDKLARNYSLTNEQIQAIQNLSQGSTLALQVYKDKRLRAFEIAKVQGVEERSTAKVMLGGKMHIEIGINKFEEVLLSTCGEKSTELINRAQSTKSVTLEEMVQGLIGLGIEKSKILLAARRLGINDKDIADAFAKAEAHL